MGIDLGEVDHVHFERVTFVSKNIDMGMINKDFNKQPARVDMIPSNVKDSIQEWLTDMELSYTEGPMNLNWKQLMATVAGDDRFYMNTHEDEVTPKDPGWGFLRIHGNESDSDADEDEDDSVYSDVVEEVISSEEQDDDESEFDSDSESSDYDGDEDLEEQGMDWDEMEKEAAADDRKKRQRGDEGDDNGKSKKKMRGAFDGQRKGGSSGHRRSSVSAKVPQRRR